MHPLIGGTSLPNLHPAIVHLPLALLPVAFLFDAAGLLLRRVRWLDWTAAALYVLGALGALGAYLAGLQAEEGLGSISEAVEGMIEDHEEWAARAMILFLAVAATRAGVAWKRRRQAEAGALSVRLPLLAAALAGLGILFYAADRGGALVYRHGVAVAAPTAPPAPAAEPTDDPEVAP
jgi:uncharacterized membrane protein